MAFKFYALSSDATAYVEFTTDDDPNLESRDIVISLDDKSYSPIAGKNEMFRLMVIAIRNHAIEKKIPFTLNENTKSKIVSFSLSDASVTITPNGTDGIHLLMIDKGTTVINFGSKGRLTSSDYQMITDIIFFSKN
ncbi:MAG: hypothetical protein Harvfovirus15_20 [Harvfovirus sp.]|uniref:Uncharacterized protein n=1 Tax=Harvfovirus sp. TaxID=2487768 RepID=A0A3G5A1G5_9VIRU|nr:MAG: hypothetical protein Harvfovirus15_20 [Harvfovirus sp.]